MYSWYKWNNWILNQQNFTENSPNQISVLSNRNEINRLNRVYGFTIPNRIW